MAKQNEVTAQSMVRRARAHGVQAKVHGEIGREKTLELSERVMHRAVAIGHRESAEILRDEAKEIRSHS